MHWMPTRLLFLVLVLQSLIPLAAAPPCLPRFSASRSVWQHYEVSRFHRWRTHGYSAIYQGVFVPGYVAYPYHCYRWEPCYYSAYTARWMPPVYQPPGLLFGPQAAQRFLEINLSGQTIPAQRRTPDSTVRKSNAETRRRAERMIDLGDRCFSRQRFHQALQHYRTASSIARDVAEPYFRQGHALIALGQFDRAARTFKRAVAMKPSLQRSGFAVAQLYQDNNIAKATHLEALAKAAWNNAHDDDLLFLLGLFLRYDGQIDRANIFFRKAFELAGPRRSHLLPFLPPEHPQEEAQVVAQRLEI